MNTEIKKPALPTEDFPLSEVPMENRKGFWSNMVVLFGFTFFSATIWAGGKLGVSMKFWPDLVLVIFFGNLMLGLYVAALGLVAFKSGLNTALLCRFSFGDWGSKIPDFLLGFTQIGWYAWGTATIAEIVINYFKLSSSFNIPMMIFFGFAFCWTAYIGYRGLEILSSISVPLMTILLSYSLYKAFGHVNGIEGLIKIVPSKTMTISAALTLVFGTFVSGGTQATNWIRFAKSKSIAVGSSLTAFFIGNGLMIVSGALGAMVYGTEKIVDVFSKQGIIIWGVLLVFLNIWTTQDNTIYNFSVAGCNMFRTGRRKLVTIIGAGIGTLMALFGVHNFLVPYLILLGTFIPPLGGLMMADFWFIHKGNYPSFQTIKFQKINWAGIISYVIAATGAYYLPGIAPLNGIVIALVCYPILSKLFSLIFIPKEK
ncbi:cytosine permease [bacterium]|nr:cytosine permease [bacterium]